VAARTSLERARRKQSANSKPPHPQDDPITPDVARRLGHRSTGIGFNQLAVIMDCNDAEARLVFWNPDGSPLNACGSATRGVADILMRETGARSVSLRTNYK
jgi:diaminopimelate epimerase